VTPELTHALDALAALPEVRLTAAFGPQHGLRGDKQDNMVESPDYVDPTHGIPVHSLYGEVRRPTDAMMQDFDVLLVDLQPAEAPTREPFLCMHRGGGARLAGRVGSLQHSEDQYEYHLERLRHVVDGALRSRQFPQACYIEAAVERLPHYWATEWGGTQTKSGPALRDWKLRSSVTAAEAASARLASNVHRLGVCASRLGAFEIYLVWQPRQQTVPTTPTAAARASVEQCFSKLFSSELS
jgi:hypothetical protein